MSENSNLPEYKNATLSFEVDDINWLNNTVQAINGLSRAIKVDKSKLVRVGIALLREKNPDEILEVIKSM